MFHATVPTATPSGRESQTLPVHRADSTPQPHFTERKRTPRTTRSLLQPPVRGNYSTVTPGTRSCWSRSPRCHREGLPDRSPRTVCHTFPQRPAKLRPPQVPGGQGSLRPSLACPGSSGIAARRLPEAPLPRAPGPVPPPDRKSVV